MARAGLGWRAVDLANVANVGPATVARFELGENISDESLRRIKKALTDAGAQFTQRAGRVGAAVPE